MIVFAVSMEWFREYDTDRSACIGNRVNYKAKIHAKLNYIRT